MSIKLTDDFLEQYHIKAISTYNNNFYKLPFDIVIDGVHYNILYIETDEDYNEHNCSLGFIENGNWLGSEIYFPPSKYDYTGENLNVYELDLDCYKKEYVWY